MFHFIRTHNLWPHFTKESKKLIGSNGFSIECVGADELWRQNQIGTAVNTLRKCPTDFLGILQIKKNINMYLIILKKRIEMWHSDDVCCVMPFSYQLISPLIKQFMIYLADLWFSEKIQTTYIRYAEKIFTAISNHYP